MKQVCLFLILSFTLPTLACSHKIKDALTRNYPPSYIRVGEANTYEQQKAGTKQVYKYYKAEVVSHNGQPKKIYRAVVKVEQSGCKLDSLKQDQPVQFHF